MQPSCSAVACRGPPGDGPGDDFGGQQATVQQHEGGTIPDKLRYDRPPAQGMQGNGRQGGTGQYQGNTNVHKAVLKREK